MPPAPLSPEEIGRRFVEDNLVRRTDCGWTVHRNKYDYNGTSVKATHLDLVCHNFLCRGEKCKHIFAVQFYMAARGEEIVLPHKFETLIPYLNERLRKDTDLELVAFPEKGGWLIDDNAEEDVPLTQWHNERGSTITDLLQVVTDRAGEVNAKIFVKIDHTPVEPDELGAAGVIDILNDLHFRSVEKEGTIELFEFDVQYVPDPYDGVPHAEILREFLDDQEGLIGDLGGFEDVDFFRSNKRELLDKLRQAKRE